MPTYEETLLEYALADERVIVMTAENRAAIRNLPAKLGERFIDVGIAEQTMIGAAAGLALRGRIPVVHALATFLTMRAFEFIRTDVGIAQLPVKLVGAVPGFLSDGNGPTHQALEDISLMRSIPGMQVFAPSDLDDLTQSLPELLSDPKPCYIRFPAASTAYPHHTTGIGRSETVRAGSDVLILTYGLLVREAIRASELLSVEGVGTCVMDVRWLTPLDEPAILDALSSVDLVVTVEDHFETGGLYSILAELMLRHRATAQVVPIALRDRWFKPALLHDVLDYEGFTGEKIAGRIRGIMDMNSQAITSLLHSVIESQM